MAFVVISLCGAQTLFNFNPLLKLNDYYLLSDRAETPNLQQRAWRYVTGQLRRVLLGAPPPAPHPYSGILSSRRLAAWWMVLRTWSGESHSETLQSAA